MYGHKGPSCAKSYTSWLSGFLFACSPTCIACHVRLIDCFDFPSLKVVSFPRVAKVADVVSILRSNKHNGFPVSVSSSFLPYPVYI